MLRLAALGRRRCTHVAAISTTMVVATISTIYSFSQNNTKSYIQCDIIQHDKEKSKREESISSSDNSSEISFRKDDSSFFIDKSSQSLFLPTIQAAYRAWKLVKTVSLMALDYQRAKWDETFLEDGIRSLKKNLLLGSYEQQQRITCIDDGDMEHQRKYWEEEIEKRSAALETAQIDYTTEPPPEEEEKAKRENEDTTRDGDLSSWRAQSQAKKKEAVQKAAALLGEAENRLAELGDRRSTVHRKAANRLLKLCRDNKGVYIKVGQHLANLDYLIPPEYIDVLSSLFDDAPISQYSDVRQVIKEDLGRYPEEIFESFFKIPIASASLAQVHVATEKDTNKKLAVKVQHRGLRETSAGDLYALTLVVKAVETMFEDFTWGWLVDEIAPQLPKELDFYNEGKNADLAAAHLNKTGLDCIVPEIVWNRTSSRVLCMKFEEGFKSTDLVSIQKAGLKTRDVAKLISSVFNSQVFQSGFVHCDPHPANVLLREHPTKPNQPQIVLVDHGLYKRIHTDFRITYAELWRALMMADIDGIKCACHKLGVDEMYPLLAAMLTSRPFDEIIERSKTQSLPRQKTESSAADKAMIRGYAQRFLREIIAMLDAVPRQMLLLFKMNDCLRHVDFVLGCPMNNLIVAGMYASRAVLEDRLQNGGGGKRQEYWKHWLEYWKVLTKIRVYELAVWWSNVVKLPMLTGTDR